MHDFEIWEPFARVVHQHFAPGTTVGGSVSIPRRVDLPAGVELRAGVSVRPTLPPLVFVGMDRYQEALDRVRQALESAGRRRVQFAVSVTEDGAATVEVADHDTRLSHELVLVEGSLPEPYRRRPVPPSADTPRSEPDLTALEATLRNRLPDARGMTAEQIAEIETRLGFSLPAELRVLYSAVRGEPTASTEGELWFEVLPWTDADDPSGRRRYTEARATGTRWSIAASDAFRTAPDARVQALVKPPEWVAFATDSSGGTWAIDLVPGPAGVVGQVIRWDHEDHFGASVVAESLTDVVLGRFLDDEPATESRPDPGQAAALLAAFLGDRSDLTVESAANPDLEVLGLGVWSGEPMSLRPVAGLPRLRTLSAYRGTLADPAQIADLPALEFLSLTAADWRVLLDRGAVPRTLLAAEVSDLSNDPVSHLSVVHEILALYQSERPVTSFTTVLGQITARPTTL